MNNHSSLNTDDWEFFSNSKCGTNRTRRLQIGLIAPEFPPDLGGMAEYARGLAEALAATDDVVVYTRVSQGVAAPTYRQKRILTGNLFSDRRRLAEEHVDVWFALNAGLVPLAPELAQPFFAYFHGNDFLKPWVGFDRFWLKVLRHVPYLENQATKLETTLLQRDICRGMRHLGRLFTNSSYTSRLIQQTFPGQSLDIEVIPPGVDASFFQKHEESSTENPHLQILTVAKLAKYGRRKNVDGVLRSLALLPASLHFQYTVIGEGDSRSRFEDLAQRLGIRDSVQFMGTVSHRELLACYRKSDLFILASKATREDVEGFGIVYLEASASGVPVICSQEGGSLDAVQDGWNGIVIPTSSPEDIAGGIVRFVNSREQFPRQRVQSFAEPFRRSKLALQTRERIASFLDSPRRQMDTVAGV